MKLTTNGRVALVDVDEEKVLYEWDGERHVKIDTKVAHDAAVKYAVKRDEENIQRAYAGYLNRSKGEFSWCVYDTAKVLYPDLKPATLSRLMLLSTYIDYGDNLLVDDKRKPLDSDDVCNILGGSKRTFYYTTQELIDEDILAVEDERYMLNNKLFKRGEISKKEFSMMFADGLSISKVYVKGVRALYKKAAFESVKKLSYVFRIMPFVNRDYNIVCFNPTETDKNRIIPMSINDVASAIGYDKKHVKRLKASLLELQFETEDGYMGAVHSVSGKNFGTGNDYLFINPKVYYGGEKDEEVAILGQFK